MKRSFIWITSVFSLVFFILSCKGPSKNQMQGGPVPVNLHEVKYEQVKYYDAYPATTIALNQVELRSELNGYVTAIYFKEGRPVKKGEKLYEIERSRYAASYEQAVASLKIAEANYDKAKKDAERYAFLLQKEAIAKQKADYAATDLENAKQQISSARANLTKAALDLNHSVINAPFDGTIGVSNVKLGTFVTAGQTILNTISSDNPIAVDFSANEKEISHFMKLRNADPKDSVFTILLPDKSIYPYPGKVEFFDRAVDPLTGTLKIRLQFPNPDHTLRPGMSCDLRVLNQTPGNVIVVPFRAVTEQMGEFFVYTVKDDTARQQKVVVGPQIESDVIIKEGITPGQKIVVEGIQKLREGTAVALGVPQGGKPSEKNSPGNADKKSKEQ